MERSNVVDWTPFSGSERPNPHGHWHPKLTGYRALVLAFTGGFGSLKAILTYRGESTGISITLEWVFSVVVFLAFYWLGLYESNDPHAMPWLFEKDYACNIWRILNLCYLPFPSYKTDERPVTMSVKKAHPPLTGYRILLIVLVTSFGLTKAIETYRGLSTAPTTIDWVFGAVVAMSMYWLGLYENSSTRVLPTLFEADYIPVVQGICLHTFRGGFATISYLLLHVFAIFLAIGWSYMWFTGLVALWNTASAPGEQEPDRSSDSAQPPISALDMFFRWSFKLFCSMGACFATCIGAVTCIIVLMSLMNVLMPVAAKSVVTHLKRWIGTEDASGTTSTSFASLMLTLPQTHPTTRTGKVLKGFMSLLFLLGHVVAHALGILLCIIWMSLWLFFCVESWKAILHANYTNFFMAIIVRSLLLIWFTFTLFALALGAAGCLSLLWSLAYRWRPSLMAGLPLRGVSGIGACGVIARLPRCGQ